MYLVARERNLKSVRSGISHSRELGYLKPSILNPLFCFVDLFF
jgi:hypothetical protein